MNRQEKIDTIERTAMTGTRTGPQGLYTPTIIENMEPSKIAAVLNAYVDRINVDAVMEARRKAYRAALTLLLVGLVLGAGGMYIAMSLWMNPIRDLLQHLSVNK